MMTDLEWIGVILGAYIVAVVFTWLVLLLSKDL